MNVSYLSILRISRSDAADHMRDQAAACRRLSSVARTPSGATALLAIAELFDADALRVNPAANPVQAARA